MLRQKLVSSTIEEVTFHAKELTIIFKSGNRYRYFEVPIKFYFEIGATKTAGKYYGKKIKKKFNSRKLEPGEE